MSNTSVDVGILESSDGDIAKSKNTECGDNENVKAENSEKISSGESTRTASFGVITVSGIEPSNSNDDHRDISTPGNGASDCETRLWIGNLDPRLRERFILKLCVLSIYGFHLLKMVQRYGTIDNFDFLFHRTGPNIGLPRGYAFVTFHHKKAAEECLKSLDGTKVLDKHVAVRWAHQATTTYMDEETKLKSKLPALSMKKEEPSKDQRSASGSQSKEKAISAIEAKLKSMEREKEMGMTAGSSASFFYQYNKEPPLPTLKQRPRPYDRNRHSQHQNRRPHRR